MDINITNPVTKEKIGEVINGANSATPNNTDLVMSVESSVAKKNTWTQIKAFLKTYFDTVYQATGSYLTSANITQTITNGVTDKAPSEDAVYGALALKSNAMLFKTNANYAHTGTTNETVLYCTSNLAGNFEANDILRILLNFNATSDGNNKTIKVYLGSAAQTQGATFNSSGTSQLLTYLVTTNSAMKRGLVRNIQFMNSLSSQQVVSTTTLGLDNDETSLSSAASLSTMTWDYSSATYLIVTGTLAAGANTLNFLHFRGQIIR